MKKPNAVLHMAGYGAVYGILLGMIYSIVVFYFTPNMRYWVSSDAVFLLTIYAVIFGAIPGAILGFIDGWIIRIMTRNITQGQFNRRFQRVITAVGVFTVLGMGIISTILLTLIGILYAFPFLLIPLFITLIASTYATHRYFLKLKAWHTNSLPKEKAKHKPKNQLAYQESNAPIDIPEAASQSKKLKTDT